MIAEELKQFCNQYKNKEDAFNAVEGVSQQCLRKILDKNWKGVKEEVWLKIKGQIAFDVDEWQVVTTRDYKILSSILNDAQLYSSVFAIVGEAGTGKSVSLKAYVADNEYAYLLQCADHWNRKQFLVALLKELKLDWSGLTVNDMIHLAVDHLKQQKNPLILFDEADKLSDQSLYFFITLYNYLEDHCGLVMIATNHLKKRLQKGLHLNKKGYKEIYSRIGRKFIELNGVELKDVTAICIANGIEDRKVIREIWEGSENDLRRVKRMIHAKKMQQKSAA
tara:strand:- start:12101 stop:12937 length:837 start_codon:yes stop_codon:yes gene_type:complete